MGKDIKRVILLDDCRQYVVFDETETEIAIIQEFEYFTAPYSRQLRIWMEKKYFIFDFDEETQDLMTLVTQTRKERGLPK